MKGAERGGGQGGGSSVNVCVLGSARRRADQPVGVVGWVRRQGEQVPRLSALRRQPSPSPHPPSKNPAWSSSNSSSTSSLPHSASHPTSFRYRGMNSTHNAHTQMRPPPPNTHLLQQQQHLLPLSGELLHLDASQVLDLLEHLNVVLSHDRHAAPAAPRARRAADPAGGGGAGRGGCGGALGANWWANARAGRGLQLWQRRRRVARPHAA